MGAPARHRRSTIDLLPECVEAVDGRIEVLVDGGVRRGTDVLVALSVRRARRARGTARALGAGGRRGGRRAHVLEILRSEIELGQALLGAPDTGAIARSHVSSQG